MRLCEGQRRPREVVTLASIPNNWYRSRDAAQILLGDPLIYAHIYIQGLLRGVFDPEFLRFFDLYPERGGLLEVMVGKSRIKSIGGLLFYSTPAI